MKTVLKFTFIAISLVTLSACSSSLDEAMANARLEIVDPTPDGDLSDAYFRDTLTGETCARRTFGRLGCVSE